MSGEEATESPKVDPQWGQEPRPEGEQSRATALVDTRGQVCPQPVITLAKQVRGLAEGTAVTVMYTDGAAFYDIPAWARMNGHEYLPENDKADGDTYWVTIRLGKS